MLPFTIVYPTVCGLCGKLTTLPICSKCKIQLETYREAKIINYSDTYFTRHCYVFRYEGTIKEKIIQFKFSNKAYLYDMFVNLLLNDKKVWEFLQCYDIIIPVPISKKRKQKRGYNQSELIARGITKQCKNLVLATKVLYKKIDNTPQSMLTKQERKQNVQGSYIIKRQQQIQDKKIVLLDDVFTTGSTVTECSKVLVDAGAKLVDVITIAKD